MHFLSNLGFRGRTFSTPTAQLQRKMVSVGLWLVLALITPQTWGSKSEGCVSSSCGKITNISHPFRLKDDPPNCGRYELECVNGVALLRLSDRAAEYYYHVQSINYNNYTIRLVDPDVHEANCSSLPRYSLSVFNFSTDDQDDQYDATQLQFPDALNDQYRATQRFWDDLFLVYLFEHIIYMRCNSPVSGYSPIADASGCFDSNTYVVAGELNLTGWGWKPGCHVMLMAPTSGLSRKNRNSYSEIHRALAYGFELSWLRATCREDHNCGYEQCYFNPTSHTVLCGDATPPCRGICAPLRSFARLGKDFWQLAHDFLKGMYRLIRFRNANVNPNLDHVVTAKEGWYTLLLFLSSRILFGVTLLVVLLIHLWRRRHSSTYANIENFLQDNDLAPIRYSYKEIKMMTKNFKVKLGQGGFGYVYKGKLRSGPHIAIKMLKESKGNGQDFINEVATIGRIHHVNVVQLIGFCVEGSKRALVYDFMSNGSLDKYIFSKERSFPLSYEKIHEISQGIACGISYLHHGCDMQILHFDIKPHNILLDENFIPKVSDFGLAKLYPIDHSIATLTDKRGTIGYIAPELFYSNIGRISHKADVYSFGMLLMEMANRRKNVNSQAQNSSQIFFPTWVYDQLSGGKEIELDNATEDEKTIAKKMIIVAFWCIQLKPFDRPSMKRVIEMLEGELEDLTMPPEPLLYPNETIDVDESTNSDQIVTSDASIIATSDFSEATFSNSLASERSYVN